MANPRVRPHLHFYAEDNGASVNEYYQASHWRESARDPELIHLSHQIRLTPMAVICGVHYYLYEPCLLKDGTACMPFE
jgi:hypothetical protein